MPSDDLSFRGLKPASESSSRSKKSTRHKDTKPELLLRRALWKRGLRFRKNFSTLAGKPDIVFIRARLVIFCDGDFWHGRDWPNLKAQLEKGANPQYWLPKITYNMERDAIISRVLEQDGWLVLRIWETDIERDLPTVVERISEALESQCQPP